MRLALYQPEIAPNVGAAIRLCACFNVPLDIIEPCGFPLKDREIKRAAMDYGALMTPDYHASWQSFIDSAVRKQGRLILLSTKANSTIYATRFQQSDILLMGQESAGVPDPVRYECDMAVRIPMAPDARSLNMAIAAGIGLSEAIRQTRYQTF